MALAEVESMIKSCVLSRKGDTTLNDLRGDYFELVGQNIPLKSFECESLECLIDKLPGISICKNRNGEPIVTVHSKKSAHIADLVSKQKTNKSKAKFSYSPKKKAARKYSNQRTQKLNPNGPTKHNVHHSRVSQSGYSRNKRRTNATSEHTYYPQRFSQTQVRIIPAGGESSDSSYGNSPIRKDNKHNDLSGDIKVPVQNMLEASYSGQSDGSHRTVNFTDNVLRCTVCVFVPKEEGQFYPTNFGNSSEGMQENTAVCSSWDNGPVILGFYLVGDDFLLHFAYESLKVECDWNDAERLTCGMCISGQTIHDFHMQIHHEGLIQARMVLMLGSVDILQNRPLRNIIDDMSDLLEDIISTSVESVVLLTLPFLKNGGLANQKIVALNAYIKDLDDGYRVHVLDAHALFVNRNRFQDQTFENCCNPKCYERYAREILCYPHGVVLWSHIGRSYLYNFLLQNLNKLLKNFN